MEKNILLHQLFDIKNLLIFLDDNRILSRKYIKTNLFLLKNSIDSYIKEKKVESAKFYKEKYCTRIIQFSGMIP